MARLCCSVYLSRRPSLTQSLNHHHTTTPIAIAGGLLAFSHIPVNDIESLKMVFQSAKFTGNEIAGVLIEPILGEGGIHVVSKEFLEAARGLCDEAGSMLIFDEVQSGMGRTGKMWACEWSGVTPDLMAIGGYASDAQQCDDRRWFVMFNGVAPCQRCLLTLAAASSTITPSQARPSAEE